MGGFMDLWNVAVIFVLSFLGLVMIIFMILFVFLAYRYDITFNIRAREKTLVEVVKSKNVSVP
jgi:hypothetical protein